MLYAMIYKHAPSSRLVLKSASKAIALPAEAAGAVPPQNFYHARKHEVIALIIIGYIEDAAGAFKAILPIDASLRATNA